MPFDIFGFGTTTITVGLSTIVGITTSQGLNSILIKYGAGGTLEIGGSGLTWGQGYPFTPGEVLSFDFRGTFFLAATGATVTAYLIKGLSEGY